MLKFTIFEMLKNVCSNSSPDFILNISINKPVNFLNGGSVLNSMRHG